MSPRAIAGCSVRVFDDHGDALTAADAEGGQAALRVAPLHFVQERDEDAGAAGADRVAESDGATVDVDALPVPAELSPDGEGLCGKCLVGFYQVDVADAEAAFGERLLRS